jgi:hypothetical protein
MRQRRFLAALLATATGGAPARAQAAPPATERHVDDVLAIEAPTPTPDPAPAPSAERAPERAAEPAPTRTHPPAPVVTPEAPRGLQGAGDARTMTRAGIAVTVLGMGGVAAAIGLAAAAANLRERIASADYDGVDADGSFSPSEADARVDLFPRHDTLSTATQIAAVAGGALLLTGLLMLASGRPLARRNAPSTPSSAAGARP